MLFSVACVETPTEGKLVKDKPFFDLKGYFSQEINRLSGKKNLTKKAMYNGQEETKVMESIDFEKELLIFSNTDINRAAWLEKYSIDSIFDAQEKLRAVEYKALDEGLKTKSIRVQFAQNSVSQIEITTAGSSAISDTENNLKYSPTAGYSIKSRQNVKFVSENDIDIQVLFWNFLWEMHYIWEQKR